MAGIFIGALQRRGFAGRKAPGGVQGQSPGRESGNEVLQRLKQLADIVYRIWLQKRSTFIISQNSSADCWCFTVGDNHRSSGSRDMLADSQTHRHTHRQTGWSQYSAPLPGRGEILQQLWLRSIPHAKYHPYGHRDHGIQRSLQTELTSYLTTWWNGWPGSGHYKHKDRFHHRVQTQSCVPSHEPWPPP